ncbi:hypothetical protein DQ04_07471010 [Trypanosoma grayi]|uniref:hypothetical protein n=1 Tax=Trypanosoma grayi TaxID=71804 RepID=UPI0004F4A64E|nr:hypothetical protein DQ04_07471010 [Trypanosoma grayi]KEG08313.1 hypothetical protein DQ04_07471010 [Trypanosoma grayi]
MSTQVGAVESSISGNPFDFLAPGGNEQQLWAEVYLKEFPDAAEVAEMTIEEQRELLADLREEVELLDEEATVLARHAEILASPRGPAAVVTSSPSTKKSFSTFVPVEARPGGGATPTTAAVPARGPEESVASESAAAISTEGGAESVIDSISTGTRRGQAYSRKSVDTGDAYVSLEDRVTMLTKERDRLRQQKDRDERDGEHLRELLIATVEEAVSRGKELRLEVLQFNREVIDEHSNTASADDLLRYMEKRRDTQAKYLDKLSVQCAAAERSIHQSQQQLRQRNAAGEAFHAIDFEQLRIENQQFNERIERKNLELVELKGTSTRTVQTLNTLMDALNGLTTEQNRLRKDFKSRCEYLARLQREMVSVVHEANVSERKNATIKAQHEAVRVPKIEHYVAQKAEEYELRKAERNWNRKVEIAEGQLHLVQQQIRVLAAATDPARRRHRHAAHYTTTTTTTTTPTSGKTGNTRASGNASVYVDGVGRIEVQVQSAPVVGGSRALLNMKRSS